MDDAGIIDFLGDLAKDTYLQMAKFRDAADIAERKGFQEEASRLRVEAIRLYDLWNAIVNLNNRAFPSEKQP